MNFYKSVPKLAGFLVLNLVMIAACMWMIQATNRQFFGWLGLFIFGLSLVGLVKRLLGPSVLLRIDATGIYNPIISATPLSWDDICSVQVRGRRGQKTLSLDVNPQAPYLLKRSSWMKLLLWNPAPPGVARVAFNFNGLTPGLDAAAETIKSLHPEKFIETGNQLSTVLGVTLDPVNTSIQDASAEQNSALSAPQKRFLWLLVLLAIVIGLATMQTQKKLALINAEQARVKSWSHTTGMILTAQVVRQGYGELADPQYRPCARTAFDRGSDYGYFALVQYRYVVDGKPYLGTRLRYPDDDDNNSCSTSFRGLGDLVAQFHSQQRIQVFYDPLQPQNAVLALKKIRLADVISGWAIGAAFVLATLMLRELLVMRAWWAFALALCAIQVIWIWFALSIRPS